MPRVSIAINRDDDSAWGKINLSEIDPIHIYPVKANLMRGARIILKG